MQIQVPVSNDADLADRRLSTAHVTQPKRILCARGLAYSLQDQRGKFFVYASEVLLRMFFEVISWSGDKAKPVFV
jgi:hypothetical protein